MKHLDNQLSIFRDLLQTEVKISEDKVDSIASTIATEIENIKDTLKSEILLASPVPLETRLEELSCFQTMMDTINKIRPRPEIVRSQVMTQNYVCFVYLKDTLFEVLRKKSETGSITKKCAKYLLNNPVRAFRNPIAHGNWKYKDDFSGLEFWAHKDNSESDIMTKYQ
ncbi:hypothetical protein Emtol_0246 (plasmid) [Emticicia oligotrophica DSM 17448]|uniref:Uncharacterized protein n=1 Tax=Emticicia oligotrophica (strain DSM 17448 / CIP 109782 / MTCC 6937 / GPTSA100-15) TaxID=929562 RepID=A0ABN4AU81_EMTOG|nr:hypothetical protein [Emticicia oligotrophica]AFK05516.1 hypothetical protein Emtol_0246 [Emticicia oligotrophica DSM 17448]